MFLSISEALESIVSTVEQALGPLANLKIEGVHVRDIIIQLVSTIILFLVVRFFLWKPITNILEKRREAIDKSLEEASVARENAKQIEAELSTELSNAKMQIKELLDKAEKDGNARREEIIKDAKEEAKRRLDNLELELQQEKKNMEKEIRQEIVDIAFAAAEKIVAKEINHDKYLNVVEDILKEANS